MTCSLYLHYTVLLSLLACICAAETTAHTLHASALRLSERGELGQAIQTLRHVVKLEPNEALYWNDLGVTEMRDGNYDDAELHFLEALRIDSRYQVAIDNIEEVRRYKRRLQEASAHGQEHNLMCPHQLTMNALMSSDKLTLMNILKKPFVIRANTTNAKIRSRIERRIRMFSLDNITSAYGDYISDYYPFSMTFARVQPQYIPLRDSLSLLRRHSIEEMKTRSSTSGSRVRVRKHGPYAHWNIDAQSYEDLIRGSGFMIPPILDDRVWLNMCMKNIHSVSDFFIKTHWKMLLIGAEDSGMFNHADTLRTGSWQIQITGSKVWHLCAPTQMTYMYDAGVVDAFHPDYDSYPLFRQANCIQVTVNAGDLVYYPKDYWHQTRNPKFPSISISSSVVSQDNYGDVRTELEAECGGRGAIFSPTGDTCDELLKCYSIWDVMFREDSKSSRAIDHNDL